LISVGRVVKARLPVHRPPVIVAAASNATGFNASSVRRVGTLPMAIIHDPACRFLSRTMRPTTSSAALTRPVTPTITLNGAISDHCWSGATIITPMTDAAVRTAWMTTSVGHQFLLRLLNIPWFLSRVPLLSSSVRYRHHTSAGIPRRLRPRISLVAICGSCKCSQMSDSISFRRRSPEEPGRPRVYVAVHLSANRTPKLA
jgi:hypothetical protein